MTASSVVYLRPNLNSEAQPQDAPRVVTAFGAALLRSPPKPPGLAACVAYLQESADLLQTRQMGIRALLALRTSLFTAPGREAEMALLWREALATACYARALAVQARFDAPLLTGAGLLHRAGEIVAMRALAQAEVEAGQRLIGPVMQQILEARDDELVARVTRCWGLPGELRLLILRWREEQTLARRPEAVSLLTMAQALSAELVHAATCAPGLAQAACESMRLSPLLLAQARACTAGIDALLAHVAPAPASSG